MPRVAAKDRDAFVEERRAEIMEAALRLWSVSGFDGTSVEAVAREAGLTKGTLYLYFPSKMALLDAVVRRYSLRPDLEALLKQFGDRSLEDVVHFMVEVVWQRLSERIDLVRLLLRELPSHLDKSEHFLEQVMVPVNLMFAAFLDERLPAVRRARINTVVAARSLVGMVLTFFVSQEVLGGKSLLPIPDDQVTSTIAELFLHGVLGGERAHP